MKARQGATVEACFDGAADSARRAPSGQLEHLDSALSWVFAEARG